MYGLFISHALFIFINIYFEENKILQQMFLTCFILYMDFIIHQHNIYIHHIIHVYIQKNIVVLEFLVFVMAIFISLI